MNCHSIPLTLIVFNARIYDPLKGFLSASALAVSNNKIVMLGTDKEVLHYRMNSTSIIDAQKRILIPCFTDCHIHFIGYVRRKGEINLNQCSSYSEVLNLIKRKVEDTPEGEWITGGGWNRNLWSDAKYPHRKHLDEISIKHFIALDSKDWHTTWVNTPVLQLTGIHLNKPYAGAKHLAINRNTAQFTGVLEEQIRLKVYDLIPKKNYDKLRKSFQTSIQELYRLGISGINSIETLDEYDIYHEAKKNRELGLRVYWYFPVKLLFTAEGFPKHKKIADDFLQISGVKIFLDGSFGSQTAELFENYENLGHSGVEVVDQQQLDEYVQKAVDNRLSCAVHAIGDKAVRKALTVFGIYTQQSKRYGLRHRIEHAQLIHPNDIPLFNKYNIFASVQPLHLAYDIPIINRYLGNRGRYTYPLGTMQKSDCKLIFGSDAPVEDINPWEAIYSALERRFQMDPEEASFYPEERLDISTCLKAYTINAALAVKKEKKLGQIKEDFLADFFLVDQDIFGGNHLDLKAAESVLTVVDGKVVYRNID